MRISLRVMLAILLFLALILLLIQSNWGQEYLTRKVKSTLESKLQTRVELRRIRLDGFDRVSIEGLTLFDRQNKVLLHSDSLSVHYALLPLFWSELKVYSLQWNKLLANVYTLENDSLNYQFILNQLAPSSKAPEQIDTSSASSWKISIGRIELNNIWLSYKDKPAGINTNLVLNHLSWRFRETDISSGLYDFNELRINGLIGYFDQQYRNEKAEMSEEQVATNPLKLLAKGKLIQLENIHFSYSDEGSGIQTGWQVGNARLELIRADIGQNNYQAGSVDFLQPSGYLIQQKGMDTTENVSVKSSPLFVKLKSLAIKNGSFGMQNPGMARSSYKKAIDFNYLGLKNIETSIEEISWEKDILTAFLKQLSVKERSGFQLKKAVADIRYGKDSLSLKKYYLQTGSSNLSNNLLLYLPSGSEGKLRTDEIGITADLPESKLVLAEALYFAPELEQDTNFKKWWNKEIRLSGRLRGNLSSLVLNQIHIHDNAGNDIRMDGKLFHISNPDRLSGELNTIVIKTGKSAIDAWLPANVLPPTIKLADDINLNGSLSGGLKGFKTVLNLQSSYGRVRLRGTVRHLQNSSTATYDIALDELDMDAGKWISDTSIGLIQASGKVKGKGFDPSSMNSSAVLTIRQAKLQGYTYQNISIDGRLENKHYAAKLNSLDSNLQASVDLRGELMEGFPSVAGKVLVDRIDLMAIGLTTSPMIIKGLVELDLSNTQPRQLNGSVHVHHVQYANETGQYQLDSIILNATAQPDEQSILLNSPFGTASLTGDYDYTKLAKTTAMLVNKQLNPSDTGLVAISDSIGSQSAKLVGSFMLPRSMEKLLPEFEIRKPLMIEARMNSDSSLIYILASQPQFKYGAAIVDSLQILAYMNADSIHTSLEFAAIDHPSFPIHHSSFTAKGEKGNINWLLAIDDTDRKPSYRIGGGMELESVKNWKISLAPEVLLNKEIFYAKADTGLIFKDGKLVDAEVEIGSDSQSIRIHHQRPDSGKVAAYLLTIKDFQAKTISSFISKDTTLAEGKINALLQFSHAANDSSITGNIEVDSLRLFGKPVGTIKADLVRNGKDIGIDGSLTGYGNNVLIKGNYGDELLAKLQLDSLQLASIEPFTSGSVTNMTGTITGSLDVNGSPTNPSLNGELLFNNGKMRVSYLNNPLSIDQQKLVFSENGLKLNQFTLKDTAGGNAIIDGLIRLEDLQNPVFDLSVNASNFMVLGPKVSEDQLMWGPARINSTIRVGGDLKLPKVDLKLKLVDKSVVGFVVPEDEPGVVNREGVIEFVNRQNPVDTTLIIRTKGKSPSVVGFSGIEFTGDIEITPASTLTIVIDPYNGDFLEVKGTTNLNLKIEQGNRITLTGIYEIEEGKYEMSLSQLIKRSFSIEKGSSITWNGDPLEATIAISAKYQVNAPAIDLIRDQSSGSRSELTSLRQKVPVEVYLDITNQLMEPTINFRLDMPEKDRNFFNGAVYTRLKQINSNESELTKQVMALLVLQTFLSENPLESLQNRNEGGIGFTAKQSVSKILSQQLNTLAGSLIKGIDLNFDLETQEDYMSGRRQESTVLNVGASKTLFNDRLTVSVGSNIGLMGNAPANGAQLIGDVLIEYKLSRDGRYRIRAYQRNQTDAILLGQIIETGVSFMLVMDFDQFREIFEKAKKQQENGRNSK
ncbi:translocation/assembly module TamB domain-containing protein [Flavihumibacter sp. UBA7668]|uniref:translocation/assembly module TamB domain-containing protein n=1 Tax=Flavihumibacter sp. UBA7668 TaxID=1946542 RepID=UPI0025B89F76|nr:translocation/assembly module TamB [Flavihumibacter sp. UBA7668]